MDITKQCFVCEKDLQSAETVVVKERGIQTCIASSIKRNDNKDKLLVNLTSITVHDLCRKTYNQEKRISAAVKLLDSPSTSRSSRTKGFDFKNKCLFCTNDASEEYILKETKKPVERRDSVNIVSTLNFRETILSTGKKRNDKWGEEVIERIGNEIDLVASDCRYHRSCLRKFQNPVKSKYVGRPEDPEIVKVIEFISTFIEENRDECQFSLRDIVRTYEGEIPNEKTIKMKLLAKYGDEIIITSNIRKDPIISFRNIGHKILADAFYKERDKNIHGERRRIVREAANIIIEDIRSQVYEVNNYPSPHNFLMDVETDIPESLRILLETIILKNKKGNPAIWTPKIVSISHAIIAAARPKSFISSLQVGLASVLNRKYGSRVLLNILSSLGFSATYEEAVLFETSAIIHPQTHIMSNAFMQFVFDNADHNVNTIDGLNTFHAMGGIQCVTPNESVTTQGSISRLKKIPTANILGAYGTVPLKTFQKQSGKGLLTVEIKNMTELNPIEQEIKLLPTDFIWLYGKSKHESHKLPGWNGFMEQITSHLQYSTSRIVFLPFINAPPSNYDTIYTALLEASNKCKKQNQKVCFVTFDQPLYHKARDIIASCSLNSDSCQIIIRLGGFHLLMSFLGSIGFIMNGSGLKELFSIAYAASSVDKMLNGHAYSRAIRAHLLVHLALAKIILSNTDISVDDEKMLDDILLTPENILDKSQSEALESIAKKFTETLNRLESCGATAKLWGQYFQMVTLVKQFIQAERMGDWTLHLECIQKMLPFFHASGHFLYAKSGQLYLQDMFQLQSSLSPLEYDQFVNKGYFAIRRSDKFWAGIWTDMTIEQTLMKDSKSFGGFTHGRGTTESVLGKWVLGMPTIIEVTDKIGNFCNVNFGTTEQHSDARSARIQRDDKDVQKFMDWFSTHPPFPEFEGIMSISTGIKGTENINCHNAQEVGLRLMEKMVGKNFGDIKLARNSRVQPISNVHTSIKINNENVSIDPAMLFQRISLVKKSEEQLKNYFNYELAPYPLSLFDELGMRKTTKSSLYDCFTPSSIQLPVDNLIHVVDGGYLLHRVSWQQKESFEEITNKYVEYVQRCFEPNSIIVFDGYPVDALMKSTKYAERLRRQQKQQCVDIMFDVTMNATVSQDKFLSNDNNKNRLIQILREKLCQAGFICKQAYEDADTVIVTTAFELSNNHNAVVIVGEDIDLLVIITALNRQNSNVYFLKPSKGKTEQKIYTPDSFNYPSIRKYILFLHAFSGCDTTSAFFRMGKTKFIKLLNAEQDLQIILGPFLCPDSHPDHLDCSAQKFIISLYGANKKQLIYLDEFRFQCFSKSTTKKSFNLASLPPTREAARQHALRVYYQVQNWLGNNLEPTDWGWRRTMNGLLPITNTKAPIPMELLKTICCKCSKGCTGNCSCRKVGLRCSVICENCQGRTCTNIDDDVDISTDVDEPIDIDMENFLSVGVEVSDDESEADSLADSKDCYSPVNKKRRMDSNMGDD